MNKNEIMVVEEPKIGEMYRYSELCKCFGEDVKESQCSRDAQLKRWRLFYDIEKQSKKYLIKEKYVNPREMLTTQSKASKYYESIYNILLMMMVTARKHQLDRDIKFRVECDPYEDFYRIKTTRFQLYKSLGFANEYLFSTFTGDYENDKAESFVENKPAMFMNCKMSTISFAYQTLDRTLKALHRRKNINFYDKIELVYNTGERRTATELERNDILEAEHDVLRGLKYKEEFQIKTKEEYMKYRALVISLVKIRNKDLASLEQYYPSLTIWVYKNGIQEAVDEIIQNSPCEDKERLYNLVMKFNGIVTERMNLMAQHSVEAFSKQKNKTVSFLWKEINPIAEAEAYFGDGDPLPSQLDIDEFDEDWQFFIHNFVEINVDEIKKRK